MVDKPHHDCGGRAHERTATPASPYHFVDSGLSNVYLAGIKYRLCRECGKQSADIPAVGQLLKAIGRLLVESRTILTGDELRFLRKRLGKKAAEFAQVLSVTPEHYSRLETGKLPISEVADKMVRAYYTVESADPKLQKTALRAAFQDRPAPRKPSSIRANISRKSKWTAEAA